MLLLPARELPLDAEAVREFRRRFRLRFSGDVARLSVYRGVSEGLAPPGIEFYLPLFFEHTASLLDYLPAGLVFATDPGLENALAAAWDAIGARHEQYRHDIERPLLSPEELYVPVAELSPRWPGTRLYLERFGTEDAGPAGTANASVRPRNFQLVHTPQTAGALLEFLESYDGRVLLAADSPGRREVISQCSARTAACRACWPAPVRGNAALAILVARSAEPGLRAPPLMLLAETELFGTRALQERRRHPQRRRSGHHPAQSPEPGPGRPWCASTASDAFAV